MIAKLDALSIWPAVTKADGTQVSPTPTPTLTNPRSHPHPTHTVTLIGSPHSRFPPLVLTSQEVMGFYPAPAAHALRRRKRNSGTLSALAPGQLGGI